jgi:Big-like domain-containing protein
MKRTRRSLSLPPLQLESLENREVPATSLDSIFTSGAFVSDPLLGVVSDEKLILSDPAMLEGDPPSAFVTTLTVSNDAPTFGEPIELTAAVSGEGAPGSGWGTVSFFDGDVFLGMDVLGATGRAIISIDSLTPGEHSLRALYEDVTGSAESKPISVTVGKAITSTELTSTLSAPVVGEPVTLTATVKSEAPSLVTAGLVTFYDGSTILGSGAIGADGTATLTTALRLGSRTLRAVYSGDDVTLDSTSTPLSLIVGRAATTTGLSVSAGTVAIGQPVTLTATVKVTEGWAFPVGAVEFREGANLLGTVALDGRGQAALTLSNLGAGSHTVTAVYLGCSTCLGGSSEPTSFLVGKAGTTTTLTTSVPAPVFGQAQTLTARVAGATAGRVDFYDGTTLLGSAAVGATGTASLAVRLNLGSHKLRAAFAGTTTAIASSSGWYYQTVTKAPTTASLSLAADGVTLRVVVRAAFAGSPIGTVIFKSGSIILGTAAVNGNGVALLRLPPLPAGTHQITAVYTGSSCFLADKSDPLAVSVA